MASKELYSAGSVFEGLKRTFHQYLEAQYHIWDEGIIAERRQLLESPGVSYQLPYLEATPFYAVGEHYSRLLIPSAAQEVLGLAAGRPNSGIPRIPYLHQSQALEAFLGRDEELIVATGTGSGKTESFLMPILGALAIESANHSDSWNLPGMRALLLYPMNALVNDQVTRLRRLLGDPEVSKALKGQRDRLATFGMYTSRTPYPGMPTSARDEKRIGTLLKKLFADVSHEVRLRLEREGKWPVKDIALFLQTFVTGPNDVELFSRHEIQESCPDLLVTNYSMLEYMLLRPLEKSIFESTARWLAADSGNNFIVVLDEAHMYRGSGGAEVAYLLRRLHARLGVERERVRYILTSASLGSSEEAKHKIRQFAANLTGHTRTAAPFSLIAGKIEKRPGSRAASAHEAKALSAFDFGSLHTIYDDPSLAEKELRGLASQLGTELPPGPFELQQLQDAANELLQEFGPAACVGNLITSSPQRLATVAAKVFPDGKDPLRALEGLLALMSFARDTSTDRVFLPVRSHLFFRGLSGLYACVNPSCSERRGESSTSAILGKLFATPRLRCPCGSRVYELFTHRDCGAAYLCGYLSDEAGDFLWHERSSGLWSDLKLLEAHFLVEVGRRFKQGSKATEGSEVWLHKRTGRLFPHQPISSDMNDYLHLLRPAGRVTDRNKETLSFNKECPVCIRGWQGPSKIMDLATKGEAPFAHLVRQQVALQPQTQKPSDQSPNGGRKSLLFSDGRQKAARLARDIPREIEQDVFRQVLLLAADSLRKEQHEPLLSHWIYVAFIHVLAKYGLRLFDGDDRNALERDVRAYRQWCESDLTEALRELGQSAPPRFTALLLRQLGSRFYSVNALTLGFMQPSAKAFASLVRTVPSTDKQVLLEVAIVFIQRFADSFAFDAAVKLGIRHQAAGYPVSPGLSLKSVFKASQHKFLEERVDNFPYVLKALEDALCEKDAAGGLYVSPRRVRLEMGTERGWFQCTACTSASPIGWWNHCPNCLSPGIVEVAPEASSYLRARKGFWRDPVVRALAGKESPLNLTVEEHTAQLSYRDVEDPSSTTEEFERRFRDILIAPDDTSIDVLSSTTTMEVGIDIGSLVAVGLRNIPPMRQNYQQRAGRAGRRGSAVSTVVTYAQNSPHDNNYFLNPDSMIAGEPVLPSVDTNNQKIIERHIRAQLVQVFFHSRGQAPKGQNIFSMLGDTWDFFAEEGKFSFSAFEEWTKASEARACFEAIRAWLPSSYTRDPSGVAEEFLTRLRAVRPSSLDEVEQSDEGLIEFLFSHGFLPSYAFPRDLCALQIEAERQGRGTRTRVVQRPQQGLNVALSEYAPGRLVVVDKKTYRIGTVAAGGTSTVVDRAERLFAGRRKYVHCTACLFTAGFIQDFEEKTACPLCLTGELRAVTVIRPEVVYPDGGSEVDEYDDEQVYSQATGAQLPLPEGGASFDWRPFLATGRLAFARNQSLVMVNKGAPETTVDGFLVCSRCGKTSIDGKPLGAHRRDYKIDPRAGAPFPSPLCNGSLESVYLGYSFSSDILLLRMPVQIPFRFDPKSRRDSQPLADALQSLCEGLVIAVGRELDIDVRELSAGYRFVRHDAEYSADLFLYDTLSGGAGYATEAGESFDRIFKRMEELLRSCDCSSSCDKCLRHYGNRFHHEVLDRNLAADLARFIRTGSPPDLFDHDRQREVLEPLAQMLRLAGWSTTTDDSSPMTARKAGRAVALWSIPSLVNPSLVGLVPTSDKKAFSPYEIGRDLPGAFSEVI
jgi:ATP-dependent helicase YprA (DUF1998 family)